MHERKELLSNLMKACQEGDINAFEKALKSPNVNVNQDNGSPNYKTALFMAANGSSEAHSIMVQRLVQHPNLDKRNLGRALIYFSSKGDGEGIDLCLKKGADVNATYLEATALHEAIEQGHFDSVKKLIHHSEIDVNITNHRNETPLLLAIIKKNKAMIELLLEGLPNGKTCQLNHISPLFGTPFVAAIAFDLDDIAMKLMKKEHSFNPNQHPGALNLAIRKQKRSLVQQFIEAGAAINNYGDKDYPEDIPSWLWQEPEVLSSPFYPRRPIPAFELPILLALQTENKAIIDLIWPYADLNQKGNSHQSALEYIQHQRMIPNHQQLWTELEQKTVWSHSQKREHSFSLFQKQSEREILPPEVTETLRGSLELLNLADTEMNPRDRKIVLSFLKDAQYSPEDIVLFANELQVSPSLTYSLDFIYCALHPQKWDVTPFQEHQAFFHRLAKNSLPPTASTSEIEERLNALKVLAQKTVSHFFKDDILLTPEEETIKNKLIYKLKQRSISPEARLPTEIFHQKGIIDDYFEAYFNEHTLDCTSGAALTSTYVEGENQDHFTPLPMRKSPPSLGNWKSLDYFSTQWKEIYALIQFTSHTRQVREESHMFKVVKAILYHEEKECSWKSLPQDFISGGVASYYKRLWEKEGKLHHLIELAHLIDPNMHFKGDDVMTSK